ncbi:hypothetical protein NDU88_002239 [Pleurodeles waltl]|uniref:Uncharacterized protein n=1 Tax=Pleurodeles waltl TaxID=8319 RepID=A0AAV7SES2_PLEWA|nr:hypothetical protein NDU88_002239 [Pleurodeles waltl]
MRNRADLEVPRGTSQHAGIEVKPLRPAGSEKPGVGPQQEEKRHQERGDEEQGEHADEEQEEHGNEQQEERRDEDQKEHRDTQQEESRDTEEEDRDATT